jgi:prepilin-type N-terminal cleavage/methylation domain-containing protein
MLDRLIKIRKDQRGFTLIELIMVIVILAILLALALPAYLGTRRRAYLPEAQQHLQEMRTQAWLFYVERGSFTGFPGPAAPQTINWTFTIPTVAADSVTMRAAGRPAPGGASDAWVELVLHADGRAVVTSGGF